MPLPLLYLINYRPNRGSHTVATVGVLIVDDEAGQAVCEFAQDLKLVCFLDPFFDVSKFHAFERTLQKLAGNHEELGKWLVTPQLPTIAYEFVTFGASPTADIRKAALAEAEKHFFVPGRRRLEPHEVKTPAKRRDPLGRTIHSTVRRDRSVVDAFLWNIKVGDYVPNDTLVIDCGYVADGMLKMFHGVPLKKNADAAKNLAFSYPPFAEAFSEREGLKTHLWGVVDENAPADHLDYASRAFAVAGVEILFISKLPEYVDRARQELGL